MVTIEKIMIGKGFTWLALLDGMPVAVYGATCTWPGVWSAFAFGTDLYSSVIYSLTRHCRRFIVPALTEHGAHLVQCFVQADYQEARQWIRMAFPGAEEECVIRGFGKAGESFVLMSWRPQEARDGRQTGHIGGGRSLQIGTSGSPARERERDRAPEAA
jgi:hypothetical protein